MQATRFPLLDSYVHRVRMGFGITWQAAIELLLIGVVVYWTLRFLQGTRGARLMRAVLVLMTAFLVVAIFSQLLELERIIFLYPYFVAGVFLIALVVFQPELRRGLMRIGETFARQTLSVESAPIIEPMVQVATSLSKRKIGVLIAVERGVPLGALMETGVRVDAVTSRELLETIFWPGSALHDLGVIVSHGRVAAAGCEFPLAETDSADRLLGSRHRAALGMSLETDALVLVVSEETGAISVAERGRLHSPLTAGSLRKLLATELLHNESKQPAAGSTGDSTSGSTTGSAAGLTAGSVAGSTDPGSDPTSQTDEETAAVSSGIPADRLRVSPTGADTGPGS